MCGLCGFVVVDQGPVPHAADMLARMTHALSHRGPDSAGQQCEEHTGSLLGLGHRRLSVIDLSAAAAQPLANEDGTIQVVFNGEIYNYRELTRELESRGHRFKSKSDTEVLVHLYEELGEACTRRLNGMFAFALWDARRRRLVLARDHLGIKPLFYAIDGRNLYFASEIKSLLCVPQLSRQIDVQALDAYLTFGFIPGPRTIFRDIRKLPPATCLVFEDGRVRLTPYWSVAFFPKWEFSESETAEKLWELVCAAVKRQMVSDVPLGAFLSGGVDSSSLVAAMTRVGGGSVATFSLGFEGAGGDELEFAAAVARHCGTRHRQFRVAPDMVDMLPRLLWHLDEPFFDNSVIPAYTVSRVARSEVTVAISGDGGDELFGGYEWTRRDQYRALYQRLPPHLRTPISRMMPAGLLPADDYSVSRMDKAKRFLFDLGAGAEAGFRRRTTVSSAFRRGLYSDQLNRELNGYDAVDEQHRLFAQAPVQEECDALLYVDTLAYLPDDCLFKVDRMSMAHGLEVRVPFLDLELFEFAARIPYDFKIKGLTSKYILKRAVERHLPKSILKQRKQGFTVPMGSWLRNGLRDLAERILLGESLQKRGFFNRETLRWMLAEHRSGRQELGHRIWSLMAFETWAKLYLDEKVASAPGISLAELAY
jgi:asparagine synthase (glutamine-hydrolysing)